jgi:hypothetical protein
MAKVLAMVAQQTAAATQANLFTIRRLVRTLFDPHQPQPALTVSRGGMGRSLHQAV